MNCARAHRLFSDCWDDELSVAEREAVHAHFGACSACRIEYDRFARTMQAVQALPRIEAPADFATRVLVRARMAEAERGAARSTAGSLWARVLPFRFEPALAAAASLAVVAGGVWFATRATQNGTIAQREPVAVERTEGSTVAPPTTVATPEPAADAVMQGGAVRPPAVAQSAEERVAVTAPAEGGLAAVTNSTAPAPALGRAETLAQGRRAARGAAAGEIPDTLFDHAYDVEFAFEPVNLRGVKGDSKVAPARPRPTSEVGARPASITF